MNPRLAKEFRPLLLPWCVAALAAAGHLIAWTNPMFAHGEFGSFLIGLAGVVFVAGILALAALPFGFELHDRTLTLLLSQPTPRLRLWREKILATTLSILALALVHGLASAITGHLRLPEAILFLAFVATAISSVGYYTLATRSIVVGIACAAGTPFAIALSIHLFIYYVLGIGIELSEQATIALVVTACAVYSTVFLWISRRQFVNLELNDGSVGRAAQVPEVLVPGKLAEIFRPRPTGAIANLIRKEISLQKPIFLVSAIFTACWLAMLLLMFLRPAWHDNLVDVFNGLTGTQIVLIVLLTGCVALGDDKSFGTSTWHLTLPVSTRRQWVTKLLCAAATLLAMAIVLPTLLAVLTLFKARVGLLAFHPREALGFVGVAAVVFVISFWSASMVTNTVRAALTTIVSLIGIGTFVPLGSWLAFEYSPGLQTNLVSKLAGHDGIVPYVIVFVALVVTFVALVQSLAQFRRIRSSSVTLLKYSLILVTIIFVGAFWCGDLVKSLQVADEMHSVSLPPESLKHKP